MPTSGNGSTLYQDGQWVITIENGLATKIERLDAATQTRKELSAEEYAWVTTSHYAMCYAMYYAGIHDYAQALASGNTELAQAQYQGMTEFFSMVGQI